MKNIVLILFLLSCFLPERIVFAEEKQQEKTEPVIEIPKEDMEIIKVLEELKLMELMENMDLAKDMDNLIEEDTHEDTN